MTTTFTEQEAQQKEALRTLWQLSKALRPDYPTMKVGGEYFSRYDDVLGALRFLLNREPDIDSDVLKEVAEEEGLF